MSYNQARNDSIRPREHSGGLGVVSAKVVGVEDVEVLDFEDEGDDEDLPEVDGETIEAE